MNPIRVSNVLDPDQGRHFVSPDMVYQQMAKFAISKKRVKKKALKNSKFLYESCKDEMSCIRYVICF